MVLCEDTIARWCTLSGSYAFSESINAVTLDPATSISSQKPNFGGNVASISYGTKSTMCFVLVDESGGLWASTDTSTCVDGKQLPDKPSSCIFNNGNGDLSVNFGSLERSSIATTPNGINNFVVSSTVYCSENKSIDVITTFEFDPVSIGGVNYIKTSTNDLGVALFYKNSLITPTSSISETFNPGFNSFDLTFEPLKANPNISSGNFTANVVMKIAIQ